MLSMKNRQLGNTDIYLSEITFGGASISGEGGGYGFGTLSETDAVKTLHRALDLGINSFDTAPIYGFGMSEVRMGKAFKGKRDKVYITSKSGITWHDNGRVNMTNEPAIAEKMIEQTLKDLQTDYVDLYMVHWPDTKFDIRETLAVLKNAQAQGKIRHIGLCNTNLEDLNKAKEVARIEAVQCKHNFFDQDMMKSLSDYLEEEKISFMSWGTLDQGILSGNMKAGRKFDEADARSWAPWWDKKEVQRKADLVDKLLEIMKPMGKNGINLGISYNLNHPQMTTILCGAKGIGQLESLVEAYEDQLSFDEIQTVLNFYDTIKG